MLVLITRESLSSQLRLRKDVFLGSRLKTHSLPVFYNLSMYSLKNQRA